MRKPIVAAALALACACSVTARAQIVTRPHLRWRTVRTEHFTVHYPAEMAAWTQDLVPRLESVHDQVAAVVGYAPPRRVTIVVEDPAAQSNGFAFPFLDEPAIALWPTPGDPRSAIGNTRDPTEQLVVHEFTHIAHLSRPSRNPRQRFFVRLAPIRLGPVALKAPRWVTEGYATYVEGKLTGSGRPYSVLRAAVLREWALEGRLPRYDQLNAANGFQGGAMAYLAGSAYLEWLVGRAGEQSLPNLWRRMSARRDRSFDAAFVGVYGASPAELYGLFTVDVTERALAVRASLRSAGMAVGDTVQRLNWATGDPAVSPDGETMAIVLRGPSGASSRVVVWRTADPRIDSAATARAARALAASDPEDVADVPPRHPGKRALATLYPVNGRPHDQPRYLPDGRGILVTRPEPLPDGALRPDLFVWSWESGGLRRITHGAAVRWPDPAPDGRTAAAVRCVDGICALVSVDLATGAVRTLADARPNQVFYRPRYAPDGSSIAVAVQEGRRWRVALVNPASGALRWTGPDDGASRYDATFLPGGKSLVEVSEAGGIANLEVLDLATGAVRPVTRVTGAAAAPEPVGRSGRIFYLSLHSRGMDLMRIALDSAARGPVVALDTLLAPAAPRVAATEPDTLRRGPLPPSHAYGLGPRRFRFLPAATVASDGGSGGIVVLNGDPVGRLTWMARAIAGDAAVPHGVSANFLYRRWLTPLGLDLFYLRHQPSRAAGAVLVPGDSLDAEYGGGTAYVEQPWSGSAIRSRLRGGVSAGTLRLSGEPAGARSLAFAEAAGQATESRGMTTLFTALTLNAAAGRTLGEPWARGVATGEAALALGGVNGRAQVTYGRVSGGAPAWERFTVGGARQPLFDDAIVAQRVALPAARFGVVRGPSVLVYRLSSTAGVLTPYFTGASEGRPGGPWYRVAGAEAAFDTPPFNLLRIPAVRVVTGAGYPLDSPDRHKLRVYGSVTYRP